MPTYEYFCEKCGGIFDVTRPISERDEPLSCAFCDSTLIKRSLSTFFAHNEKGTLSKTKPNCSGCAGGSCSTCGD